MTESSPSPSPNPNPNQAPKRNSPDSAKKRSFAGSLLGWVVAPCLFAGSIVGGGAYVGANLPDHWVTRAVGSIVEMTSSTDTGTNNEE